MWGSTPAGWRITAGRPKPLRLNRAVTQRMQSRSVNAPALINADFHAPVYDTGATHLACDVGAFETGETPSPSVIGYIEACYYCTNAWTFNGAALGLLDGPAFMIENVTSNPITNVSFAASGDSFNVGTVPANSSVVLVPGVSNDGGGGHTFWNFTGTILDTSDSGPDADTTPFDLSGKWNAASVDTSLFTPSQSKSPANDGTVASINFLGGPNGADGPCNDCYGPEVVATITLQGEGAEKLVVNPSPPSKLNFGTVSVGTTSASQTATITSEFNDDTVDFFATFILANYIKTGSTCGSTLGPLQSCQVSFACKPKTTGPLIGAYAFLYGSVETAGLRDGDDYLKIGVAQFTCTGS